MSSLLPRVLVRDRLAALLRAAPPVRGKGRLGQALCLALTDLSAEAECLVDFHMRDGTRMCVDLRSGMERSAFWSGEYDTPILRRLATCLRPGSVVLDVGANIGFYALFLGRRLQQLGGGRLLALEPVPQNFARLSRVVADNDLGDVVRPLMLALGAEAGTISLQVEAGEAQTGNAMISSAHDPGPHEARGAQVSARIVPLDTLARDEGLSGCDLVKIDIEGAEHLFFQGGRDFLGRHRPVIYGEFSPHFMKRFGHSLLDVAELALPWGYRFYRQVGHDRFQAMDPPEPNVENLLMAHRDTAPEVLRGLGVLGAC